MNTNLISFKWFWNISDLTGQLVCCDNVGKANLFSPVVHPGLLFLLVVACQQSQEVSLQRDAKHPDLTRHLCMQIVSFAILSGSKQLSAYPQIFAGLII